MNQPKNQPKNQTMNNMTSDYFHNDVKFTGSAFESPNDAATILLQFVSLMAIVFGLVERRN
jgi:hypothetical protein